MTDSIIKINGQLALVCGEDGATVRTDADAVDVIALTFEEDAALVVIPTARLDAGFFDLRTGLAGQVMQKFTQYQRTLVVLGDISAFVARSEALAALVRESNRGRHVWFEPDRAALEARLSR